jgi:hypothetical protein
VDSLVSELRLNGFNHSCNNQICAAATRMNVPSSSGNSTNRFIVYSSVLKNCLCIYKTNFNFLMSVFQTQTSDKMMIIPTSSSCPHSNTVHIVAWQRRVKYNGVHYHGTVDLK